MNIKSYILKVLDTRRHSAVLKQSVRNSFYNLADYALLPLLWMVATPLFLHHLGTDQYGVWALANTIMGLGGAMAFGLTDATIKFVSQYRAKNDMNGVVRVIQGTLAMYSALGLFCGTVIIASAPYLVDHVFSVLPRNHNLAIEAVRIAGLGLAIRFLDSVFLSSLQGYERYDVSAKFSMGVSLATMLANMYSVWSGQGLRVVLLTIAGMQLIGAIGKAIALSRLMSTLRVFFPLLSVKTLREIFSFGLYSWVQDLSSILLGQSDRFLIASMLGTSALGRYVVCLQLGQQIHVVVAKTFSFLFPFAAGEKEKGNIRGLLLYFRRGMIVSTVIGVSAGIALFMNASNILTLWMGKDFALSAAPLLRILALSFALMATTVVPFYFMNGAGYVRLNTIFGLISGACVSLGAILLIPWLGIAGAAWSRLSNLPTGVLSRTLVYYKVLNERVWYAGILIIVPVFTSFALAFLFLKSIPESPGPLMVIIPRVLASAIAGGAIAALQCAFIYKERKPKQVLDPIACLDVT